MFARCSTYSLRSTASVKKNRHATRFRVNRPSPVLHAQNFLSPSFAFFAANNYCTSAATPKELSLLVDGAGVLSLAVPLPSNQTEVFRMSQTSSVRTLLNDIQTEDASVKVAQIKRNDGNIVARATLLKDILYTPWRLEINDQEYIIKSARSKISATGEYTDIVETAEFQQIKQRIEKAGETKKAITFTEFSEWCEDLGVEDPKGVCSVLHDMEVIFHFKEHSELQGLLFLHAKDIVSRVQEAMDVSTIKTTQEERLQLVKQLEEELKPMHEEYQRLRAKASRSAAIWAWGGLGVLCGQFLIFARLTWWEYAWDVMEPITYFVTVVETVVAGYIFYMYSKNEFTFISARKIWVENKLKSLISSGGFPIKDYEDKKQKRLNTLAEIEIYRDQPKEDDIFADDDEEL
mmetsp:Transcript_24311/g.27018  ORF Transcript_24311/g.27018 Transcript_24311/m.27018 type:complete len:405 (+) Transcript_24311:28-1242(+)